MSRECRLDFGKRRGGCSAALVDLGMSELQVSKVPVGHEGKLTCVHTARTALCLGTILDSHRISADTASSCRTWPLLPSQDECRL